MAPPPPPRSLPEELVEQILLRFPPDDPARLVHAALVCKPWCAIVSGAGFRRRFCELHRSQPLLGFVSNAGGDKVDFVPTCSLPASRVHSNKGLVRVIDAHHSRVLLQRISVGCNLSWSGVLVVWDPTTDVQEEVPVPDLRPYRLDWAAAVVCGAGGHLDCRLGPFLIVFVGYHHTLCETIVRTYSSSTASWSKPIASDQLPFNNYMSTHVAHVESAVYFGVLMATDSILKFDLESQEISSIQTPVACLPWHYPVLSTTEGGGLGLASIHEFSKLYMWSRDDVSQGDATWTQSRVIELDALLPVHTVLVPRRLLGCTVGAGVIFVESNNVLFVIDLKTHKVIKEVSEASEIDTIIPYMSFYTPAIAGPSEDDQPRGGAWRDDVQSCVASCLLRRASALFRNLLYILSTDEEFGWGGTKIIDLEKCRNYVISATRTFLIGFSGGVVLVFMKDENNGILSVDIKSAQVKVVDIIPYINFCTPATKDDEPRAGSSRDVQSCVASCLLRQGK